MLHCVVMGEIFTKQQNLDLSELEAFADNKINVAQMMIFLFEWVVNIVEKKIKCWLPAFYPFPTMFSKGFFPRFVKSQDCVVKS